MKLGMRRFFVGLVCLLLTLCAKAQTNVEGVIRIGQNALDYYGAIGDCSLSIGCDPYIGEVYRLRAINYIRTDNFEGAAADYHTLITERGDKDRDVWFNAALCLNQLKR